MKKPFLTKTIIQNRALTIDAEQHAENIQSQIRKLLNENAADGIIIGLSGGIDSAVLATLTTRAVGAERFCAYYLYDRDSSKQSQDNAKLMADWLKIKLICCDITPEMKKLKIYSPLIMKITALSASLNRFLNTKLHRLFHHESPFISTLRKGSSNESKPGDLLYNKTVGAVEAAFNARHIYRRKFLTQKAEEKNYLLLGAANRSECMVGWFVKNGIDDMPLSPIIGLYKTQVQELAKYLDLPSEIQNQTPSPDMAKGVTDENALGISYGTLDVILYYIDQGMSDEQIISKSIRKQDVELVRTTHKLSEWKRKSQKP
jgi:NAD+ synthase